MPKQQSVPRQSMLVRLSKLHFLYVLAFIVTTIAGDSWALIPPEAVLRRWTMATFMLVVITAVWYMARNKAATSPKAQKLSVATLVLLDIALATFVVYAERGMASRGVALYAVPIAVSATLMNPSAIFATATICAAAYALAAVRYFVVYFNEGLRIELYSSIGFYGATFFIVAAVLSLVVRHKSSS